MIKGGAEGLPSCGSSQVGPPDALDVESSVLATFVFLTLESAKLGVVEDVVVGGGSGATAAEIDFSSALVGSVAKEREIHVCGEERVRKKARQWMKARGVW